MRSTNSVDLHLLERMHFAVGTGTGHDVHVDTEIVSGGDDAAARPVELLLAALGSCMGMDAISILRKMRQDVSMYDIHVEGALAEQHPRAYTSITMTQRVRGRRVGEANVARALQLPMSRYCPVYAMLHRAVPIAVRYEVTEEASGARAEGKVEREDASQVEAS